MQQKIQLTFKEKRRIVSNLQRFNNVKKNIYRVILETFIKIIILFAELFVIMKYWEWFITDFFNFPKLGFIQTIGIYLFVRILINLFKINLSFFKREFGQKIDFNLKLKFYTVKFIYVAFMYIIGYFLVNYL